MLPPWTNQLTLVFEILRTAVFEQFQSSQQREYTTDTDASNDDIGVIVIYPVLDLTKGYYQLLVITDSRCTIGHNRTLLW